MDMIRYSAEDEALLRAIATIAVRYVRHVGISVDASEPTLRFARGKDVSRCPVAPVRADVVSISDLPPQPLYHGIFLHKPEGSGPMYVYVSLFQFCEFLVEFETNYTGPILSSGYLVNLVSGLSENRAFAWVLGFDEARRWVNEKKIEPARFAMRFAPLQYYLSQRERLWIERACLIGMDRFFQAQDRGGTKEVAANEALMEANRVLARYDMQIEKLDIK